MTRSTESTTGTCEGYVKTTYPNYPSRDYVPLGSIILVSKSGFHGNEIRSTDYTRAAKELPRHSRHFLEYRYRRRKGKFDQNAKTQKRAVHWILDNEMM